MAQFIVRNLEDDIRDKLRELARSHGRSMEDEVRHIIRGAVMGQGDPRPGLGSRLVERFSSHGLDEDITEVRGQVVEPPRFGG